MIVSWAWGTYRKIQTLTSWKWYQRNCAIIDLMGNAKIETKENENAYLTRSLIFKNNGRHNLLLKLSAIPASKLLDLLKETKTISYFSPKYEVVKIIIAFCYFKLFPKIDKPENV